MMLPAGIDSNVFVLDLEAHPAALPANHITTVCTAALDIQWHKGSTRACNSEFCFCVQERVRVSYLKTSEGVCDADRFLLFCLIPLLAHIFYHSRQECLGSVDGSGMCFDHALVILGLYEGQLVLMWSDWWMLRPACWEETRRLAEARKHIPPPHDAAMRDMLHRLGPEMMPFECIALPQRAKCEQCITSLMGPLHHATFVYLNMLWEFHWTCFSLSSCFHVAFFFFFFFYSPTPCFVLVWMFCLLITLHAVLKWFLGKVRAEWVNVCVFVRVCV